MVMKMSKKGIAVIFLIILGLAAVIQLAFNLTGFGADDMQLVNTNQYVSYGVDSNPLFYSNGTRSFFLASRTGVRNVNDRGENRWSPEHFSLTRPHMAARGDIVAVGEAERARLIYMFNNNELQHMHTLDNPAMSFFVNSSGFLSVISQIDTRFQILVFNHLYYGNDRAFGRTIAPADHPMQVPVIADVSVCGRYVAIAYLDMSRNLTTSIEFFNRREAPQGTDGLFAHIEFPGETILAMRFMEDNHLLIITEARITLQRIEGNARHQVWEEPIHNVIQEVAFDGDSRFAFVAGTATSPDGRYADPLGTVNIFDLGGQTGRFYFGRRGTHLSMGHGAVIVGSERYFRAVNAQGQGLWHFIATQDVRDIIFLNDTNSVLVAGSNRAYVWRRQRARQDVAEE